VTAGLPVPAQPGSGEAPFPLDAARFGANLLGAVLTGSVVEIRQREGDGFRTVAGSGLLAESKDQLPSALVAPLLRTSDEQLLNFAVPAYAQLHGLLFATAAPVSRGGTTTGVIVVLSADPLDDNERRVLRTCAKSLADAAAASSTLPRSLVHDGLSELSIILSATECLERYGSSWDEEKRKRFLSKITAAVKRMTAILHS